MLPDEFIQEFLAHEESIDQIGNSLIEAANAEGGHDNISVILAQIDTVLEIPAVPTKVVKDRPEAITAKSNISGPKLQKLNVLKEGLMKVPVLIFILSVTLLTLAYVFFTSKNKVTSVLPDEQEQIQMGTPGKADSTIELPMEDPIPKGQPYGIRGEIDTTRNIK
jgi:hypothetical protein